MSATRTQCFHILLPVGAEGQRQGACAGADAEIALSHLHLYYSRHQQTLRIAVGDVVDQVRQGEHDLTEQKHGVFPLLRIGGVGLSAGDGQRQSQGRTGEGVFPQEHRPQGFSRDVVEAQHEVRPQLLETKRQIEVFYCAGQALAWRSQPIKFQVYALLRS